METTLEQRLININKGIEPPLSQKNPKDAKYLLELINMDPEKLKALIEYCKERSK